MTAASPPMALEAFLARTGMPWYAVFLQENSIANVSTLQRLESEGTLFDALADAGVESKHAQVIAAELAKLKAAQNDPHAAGGPLAEPSPPAQPSPAPPAAGDQPPTFTAGGIYNPRFLSAVLPLFDQTMGAENVGPLLYSILRFVKPTSVLEVGGGFTSIFLLQALADNAAEVARYKHLRASGLDTVGDSQTQWSCDPFFAPAKGSAEGSAADRVERAQLHCIDNMAHEHTTAHKVVQVAQELGVGDRLQLHVFDAFDPDLPATLAPGVVFDFIWIDLGAAHRLGAFFEGWWPRLCAAGGHVAVHSTLTNQLTRDWLERIRTLPRAAGEPMGEFEQVSLLEPHKLFQNSITLLKKRGDAFSGEYKEPVYSKYP